ncbi:MAG: phosphotriesterase [Clostridiaceae bacterium]|nr:phosphotriesterase [Clostridiaceae bacterium]
MVVNSVLGKISTDQLGCVLMHEHIVCCDWSMRMAFQEKWFDYNKVVEIAVAQLKKAKENFGITTIVDGTAVNLGRDIYLIKEVSEKSGVNIIASSGMYYNEEPYLMGKPTSYLIDLMLEECLEGIQNTNVLPGILKTATDSYGLTELNKNLLYITSVVHRETDLPIFAHSDSRSKVGLIQQDEFQKNGVDLSRVIIGHSGDSNDLGYLVGLLTRGSYIGMDRFGDDEKNSLLNRCRTIAELCKRGWSKKMVLSHDFSAYIDWGNHSWEKTKNADYLNLDVDYTYVHRKAIPVLQELGVTEEQINDMLIENPKRFFEGY